MLWAFGASALGNLNREHAAPGQSRCFAVRRKLLVFAAHGGAEQHPCELGKEESGSALSRRACLHLAFRGTPLGWFTRQVVCSANYWLVEAASTGLVIRKLPGGPEVAASQTAAPVGPVREVQPSKMMTTAMPMVLQLVIW